MNRQSFPQLGQHWLFDQATLQAVVAAGEVNSTDTVLEIGPGLGTLTQLLLKKAKKVIAIEKDPMLAKKLDKDPLATTDLAKKLEVVEGDILRFDLAKLPPNYKVVANIPYYLTSNLLRRLLEDPNPPSVMALMVQKEVAQRIVAKTGQMSLLAFSVQYYAQARLIKIVSKELFQPMPKVDSAIIQIKRRARPYFAADRQKLFQIVKAGFASKRKQLKNSLAGGLHLSPTLSTKILAQAQINPASRAQELRLDDWQRLYSQLTTSHN